jgi:hypothetical protein
VSRADEATGDLADRWRRLRLDPEAAAAFADSLHRAARWALQLCARQQIDPSALSRRAWNALGTLSYLGDGSRLAAVVEASGRAHAAARRVIRESGRDPAPVRVEWRAQRSLFRARLVRAGRPSSPPWAGETGVWNLRLSLGYVDAPPAVLRAIWRSILHGRSARARMRYESYARSRPYRRETERIAQLAGARPRIAAGRHHDLAAIRDEGVEVHLGGPPEPGQPAGSALPAIGWSDTLPDGLLGRYDPIEETITVTTALDDGKVPREAVAYVVYHELLHHALPARWRSGRLVAHTPALRSAEARFPRADHWDRWLAEWMAHRRRGRRRKT